MERNRLRNTDEAYGSKVFMCVCVWWWWWLLLMVVVVVVVQSFLCGGHLQKISPLKVELMIAFWFACLFAFLKFYF